MCLFIAVSSIGYMCMFIHISSVVYVCVLMCMTSTVHTWMLLCDFYYTWLRTASGIKPHLVWGRVPPLFSASEAMLTGPLASGDCLFLPPTFPHRRGWVYRHALPCLVCTWFWWFYLKSSWFSRKHFTHWAISPACIFFLLASPLEFQWVGIAYAYASLELFICKSRHS